MPDDVMLLLSTWASPKYMTWTTTRRKRKGDAQVEETMSLLLVYETVIEIKLADKFVLFLLRKTQTSEPCPSQYVWAVCLLLCSLSLSTISI